MATNDGPVMPAIARIAEIDRLIDQWFFERFTSTRLGHDTELWNLVLAAKEDLKTRVAASIKEI
jgi:hypothetical protein